MKEQPDELYSTLMEAAIEEARQAFHEGEVPVGAVLAVNGEIIARTHNRIERDHDASAHAEILAIREASQKIENWRLLTATLCVTLEPCIMCAGAIRLSRISTVVYGAPDLRMGGFGTICDISQDSRLGPLPEVISGMREEECAMLMREFFRTRREQNESVTFGTSCLNEGPSPLFRMSHGQLKT